MCLEHWLNMEHIHDAELPLVLGDSPNELVLLACADEQCLIQSKKGSSLAILSYDKSACVKMLWYAALQSMQL